MRDKLIWTIKEKQRSTAYHDCCCLYSFFTILRRSLLSSAFRLSLLVVPSPNRTGTILPRSENNDMITKWCLASCQRYVVFRYQSPHHWRIASTRLESNQIKNNNQFGCACIEAGLNFFPIVSDRSNIVLEELFISCGNHPVRRGLVCGRWGYARETAKMDVLIKCFYFSQLPLTCQDFRGIKDHRLGVTFESKMSYGNGLNILCYNSNCTTHETIVLQWSVFFSFCFCW